MRLNPAATHYVNVNKIWTFLLFGKQIQMDSQVTTNVNSSDLAYFSLDFYRLLHNHHLNVCSSPLEVFLLASLDWTALSSAFDHLRLKLCTPLPHNWPCGVLIHANNMNDMKVFDYLTSSLMSVFYEWKTSLKNNRRIK